MRQLQDEIYDQLESESLEIAYLRGMLFDSSPAVDSISWLVVSLMFARLGNIPDTEDAASVGRVSFRSFRSSQKAHFGQGQNAPRRKRKLLTAPSTSGRDFYGQPVSLFFRRSKADIREAANTSASSHTYTLGKPPAF